MTTRRFALCTVEIRSRGFAISSASNWPDATTVIRSSVIRVLLSVRLFQLELAVSDEGIVDDLASARSPTVASYILF